MAKSLRFKKFIGNRNKVRQIKRVGIPRGTGIPEVDREVEDLERRKVFPALDRAVINTRLQADEALVNMSNEAELMDEAVDDAIPTGEL